MEAKQSRPVSIIITQILMLLFLVPLATGLVFAFVRGLVVNPSGFFSLRTLLFMTISFGLVTAFLVYGFGGLWKRKKHGYWLGLLFLAVATVTSIFRMMPKVHSLIVARQNQSASALLGHDSETVMIADIVTQSVMFVLVLVLLLKLALGKTERSFLGSANKEILR